MPKRKFTIPVVWQMAGDMVIEAESLDEAIEMADSFDLPKDADYIDGSFEVNNHMIPYLNNGLSSEEIEEHCHEIIR